MSTTLDHTLTVKKGPVLRLFLWTYNPPREQLNTCWLLWGFLFMVFALPVSAFIQLVLLPIVRPIAARIRAAEARAAKNAKPIPTRSYEPKKPKKPSKVLPAISNFFSDVWFKVHPHLPIIGAVVGGAASIWAAITINNNWNGFVNLMVLVGITVGSVAVVVLIIALINFLFSKFELGRAIKAGFHSFHNHTCANIQIKE